MKNFKKLLLAFLLITLVSIELNGMGEPFFSSGDEENICTRLKALDLGPEDEVIEDEEEYLDWKFKKLFKLVKGIIYSSRDLSELGERQIFVNLFLRIINGTCDEINKSGFDESDLKLNLDILQVIRLLVANGYEPAFSVAAHFSKSYYYCCVQERSHFYKHPACHLWVLEILKTLLQKGFTLEKILTNLRQQIPDFEAFLRSLDLSVPCRQRVTCDQATQTDSYEQWGVRWDQEDQTDPCKLLGESSQTAHTDGKQGASTDDQDSQELLAMMAGARFRAKRVSTICGISVFMTIIFVAVFVEMLKIYQVFL